MLAEFIHFILAREKARLWRLAVAAESGTAPHLEAKLDPIIRKYRFCNVNREHDKVTRWIDINMRQRFVSDPSLWFALIVARLINQPNTLARIYPGGATATWDPTRFVEATDPSHPGPIFNAAYIVSTNGATMVKNLYLCDRVLQPIWEASEKLCEGWGEWWSCAEWADWLLQFNGMGDFMVNQIVTDYKYSMMLCGTANDRDSFVMAGPGTIRGLNRYHGRPVDKGLNRAKAKGELLAIKAEVKDYLPSQVYQYFHDLNNLSNCFCEFDKYQRAVTGIGKPKQLYRP